MHTSAHRPFANHPRWPAARRALSLRVGWLLLLPLVTAAGCGTQAVPPPPRDPVVDVAKPVEDTITDYEYFPGRTDAVETINVRARVTGYLKEAKFKEGDDVKKGTVLFLIDPRPYEAEHKKAKANLDQAKVRFERLERDLQRAQGLQARKSISQEDYDKVAGDRNEAEAAISVARAQLETADLNLSFTRVKAEIDGRISRRLLDPGNLVKADDTLLTTILSMNPMYAYFDVDERTMLRARRLIQKGKIESARKVKVPVDLELTDEKDFPHHGTIDFVDNTVDPSTGTLRVRGVFENAEGVLSPGMFVRVRVRIGVPHKALLIAESALGTNQGQKFVYVVKKGYESVDGKQETVYRAVQRPVQLGPVHLGRRVIDDGLQAGDQIVVNGLQRVRDGAKIQPRELPEMPRVAGNALPAGRNHEIHEKHEKKTEKEGK